MKIVNNFEQIKSMLKYEDENDFYFVQIIQRKKEHENLCKNNKLIKTYHIASNKLLDKFSSEICILCKEFKARAYIHLARRNKKDLVTDMLVLLAESIRYNQYKHVNRVFNHVCGRSKGKDRTWIVDLDYLSCGCIERVKERVSELQGYTSDGETHLIETPNGHHLITKPFNVAKFKQEFPFIKVHKNKPTILYAHV